VVKNQHLLAALAALGVVNVLAVGALVVSERGSARGMARLEHELNEARDEQRRTAATLGAEAAEVRGQLQEALSSVDALREEVAKARSQLARTRQALRAVEERLEKAAPADAKGAGGEGR
jgi:BMFP domain-containing protein YqiC